MTQTSVIVIVLSYNNTADTLACLDSLQRHRKNAFDVLVVDNASTDGASAAIRAQHPEIRLIQLNENRGWAGGNNVGIELALKDRVELICLLNNDTMVPTGAITALAEAARRCGPCLMHPSIDYMEEHAGAQLDPKLSIGPGRFTASAEDETLFELDFAYGACLMVPADLFRRIGAFDERFFLQLEETDFWMRARRIGVRSLCTTTARILHAESRSFGGRSTPMKTYYTVRNSLLIIEKHCRTPAAAWRAVRSLYWSISRVAYSGSEGRMISPLMWPLSRDVFLVAARAGLRDYLFRRFGPISPAAMRMINSVE